MASDFDTFITFDRNDTFSAKDLGLCIGAIAVVVVLLGLPSWLGGSLHVALLAGIGILALILGFDLEGHFTAVEWIGQMLAGWCLATCVEGAGGLRWMTDFIAKWFKHTHAGFSKWRWAWIFIAASMAYLVAILSGSAAAIAFLMYPLAIEVSKDIGLRPGKAVAGVLIGAQFGEIGSPLSALFENYVTLPIKIHNKIWTDAKKSDQWAINTGFPPYRPFPSNMDLSLILIPATYIGVLLACTLAIWYGNDLSQSKTFKRRLVAGLVRCNHPEWYLTDHELQQMTNNLMMRNSKKDGLVMADDGGVKPQPITGPEEQTPLRNPLRDFSCISVLTEGDYIRSIPMITGDLHVESVDINRRQDLPPPASRGEEVVTQEGRAPPLAEEMNNFQAPVVARVVQPYRTSRQLLSLLIATAGVCWVIVYAILHSEAAGTILVRGRNYLNVIGTYLTCSILVLLACSVPVEQLTLNRYFTSALVGVINAAMVCACFQILVEKYGMTDFGNASISNAMKGKLAVVPFLAAGLALIFNNWTETAALFFLAMVGTAKDKAPCWVSGAQYDYPSGYLDYRYFVGFIPALGIVNLLPWHSLSLYAIEIDDTRTTRYGKYWLDNSFAGPIFVAAAAATGIAVGISVAVISESDNPMPIWWYRWLIMFFDPTKPIGSCPRDGSSGGS